MVCPVSGEASLGTYRMSASGRPVAALLMGLKGTVKVGICFTSLPILESPNHILPGALLASVQTPLALGAIHPQTPLREALP